MDENQGLSERVRGMLANTSNVVEKKMFGSMGFMVNGKLCLGAGDHKDHQMLVRVGPNRYEEAIQRKGAKPAKMRGREMKGYVFLDEEAIETEADLRYWVELALDYNKSIASVE